jgi:hypothetical protein
MRACLDTNAATGAEFTLKIKYNGFSILDFVDLIL